MAGYFPPPRAGLPPRLEAGDRALARVMQANGRSLRRGTVLVTEGERRGMIYRLVSGLLARYRILSNGSQQIVLINSPGDLIGLKGMLLDRQLDSLQALSGAALQSLDYASALQLARDNPDVALRYMWQLCEDERRLHNWVTALGHGSAIERVALIILDLRGRLMEAGVVSDNRFALPLTQQQIGDHLGLTLVHVNRTLRRLRNENVLTFRAGVVQINDLDALRGYAAALLDVFERDSPAFGGEDPGARSE